MRNSLVVQRTLHSAILDIRLNDYFDEKEAQEFYDIKELDNYLNDFEFFNYDLIKFNGETKLVISL